NRAAHLERRQEPQASNRKPHSIILLLSSRAHSRFCRVCVRERGYIFARNQRSSFCCLPVTTTGVDSMPLPVQEKWERRPPRLSRAASTSSVTRADGVERLKVKHAPLAPIVAAGSEVVVSPTGEIQLSPHQQSRRFAVSIASSDGERASALASAPHIDVEPTSPTTSEASAPSESAAAKTTRHENLVERFQVRRLIRESTPARADTDQERAQRETTFAGDDPRAVPHDGDGNRHKSSGRQDISSRRQSLSHSIGRLRIASSHQTSPDKPVCVHESARSPPTIYQHHQQPDEMRTKRRDPRSSRFSLRRRLERWRRILCRKVRGAVNTLLTPLSPLSATAIVRNGVLVAAFAIYVVDYPLTLAFTSHISLWASVAHPTIELIFLVDFLLMFNTSFVSKRGELVTSRREIATTYLRGWFLLDLLSSVPIHLLVRYESGSDGETPRLSGFAWVESVEFLFRIERVVHVLKLAHFFWFARLDRSGKGILTWLLYSRYSHLFRIFWIVLFIALVAHYVAVERAIGGGVLSESEAAPMFNVTAKIAPSRVPTRVTLRGDVFDAANLRHSQLLAAQQEAASPTLYQGPDCPYGSDDDGASDDVGGVDHDKPGLKTSVAPAGTWIHHLRKGQGFGEMALLMNYQRTANARAVSHVELCVLKRAAFQQILVKYPEDRKKVIGAMLGSCMVHNEANAVHCPLKEMVQSVYYSDSKDDGAEYAVAMNGEGPMRAEDAAALIMDVINPELDDKSIQFGVNTGLWQRLAEKRDQDRDAMARCERQSPGTSRRGSQSASASGDHAASGEDDDAGDYRATDVIAVFHSPAPVGVISASNRAAAVAPESPAPLPQCALTADDANQALGAVARDARQHASGGRPSAGSSAELSARDWGWRTSRWQAARCHEEQAFVGKNHLHWCSDRRSTSAAERDDCDSGGLSTRPRAEAASPPALCQEPIGLDSSASYSTDRPDDRRGAKSTPAGVLPTPEVVRPVHLLLRTRCGHFPDTVHG
ncbi:hypothetical protein PybrP1_005379, partial [[Pythium] brassicae (nom. inval.)]